MSSDCIVRITGNGNEENLYLEHIARGENEMRTVVIMHHRTTEVDINEGGIVYDIRGRKPSDSRMAIHQWPSNNDKYIEALPRIIAEVERVLSLGKKPSTWTMKKLEGIKIRRANFCENKFFAEVQI